MVQLRIINEVMVNYYSDPLEGLLSLINASPSICRSLTNSENMAKAFAQGGLRADMNFILDRAKPRTAVNTYIQGELEEPHCYSTRSNLVWGFYKVKYLYCFWVGYAGGQRFPVGSELFKALCAADFKLIPSVDDIYEFEKIFKRVIVQLHELGRVGTISEAWISPNENLLVLKGEEHTVVLRTPTTKGSHFTKLVLASGETKYFIWVTKQVVNGASPLEALWNIKNSEWSAPWDWEFLKMTGSPFHQVDEETFID